MTRKVVTQVNLILKSGRMPAGESLWEQFGRWRDAAAEAGDTTNVESEFLYAVLAGLDGGVNAMGGLPVGDTDAALEPDGRNLPEILDGSGNPLVFLLRSTTSTRAGRPAALVITGGGLATRPDPISFWYAPVPGRDAGPVEYQVWSVGPDGRANTDDDIDY